MGGFTGPASAHSTAMLGGYRRSLGWALAHPRLVLLVLLAMLCLNGYLYVTIPKGFFPQQDTGRLTGSIQADQAISFQLMSQKLAQFVDIVKSDPAVDTAVGFTGSGQTNSGFMFISLKPLAERKISADQVIARLRQKLAAVSGATLYLQAVQDIRVGGRQSNAQYQYTLQGDTFAELNEWAPKLTAALQAEPKLTDVSSDQQNKGLETNVVIDRDTAARLGITVSQIDNTLYDAFGQRQVSTIYVARNQYHVVMEVAPQYWQNPETLKTGLRQHLRRRRQRIAGHQRRGRDLRFAQARRRPRRPPRRMRRATWRPIRSAMSARAQPRPARRSAPAPKT